jgi:5S rRNA maturation endonuclease (ribonuclease M5)
MEKYTSSQVKEVLEGIGIKVHHASQTDYFCYCPFHNNTHTPSFAISKSTGAYICYNPSCDSRGGLEDLIIQKGSMGQFEAMRFLRMLQKNRPDTFDLDLENIFDKKPDFVSFPQETLDRLHTDLSSTDKAKDYFISRNINEESMDYFWLGYSNSMDMVTVPLHSPDGLPVGIIGRSIEGKRFKNSDNLPRSLTMFNLHRAKKLSATLVVCESSFDAIRIHQAGYPNVVATLGGAISKQNVQNLNKYSSSIIIATDADEAGRKLGMEIVGKLPNKNISWASFDDGVIYPNGAKDVGDLTDSEIKQCIKNAISHFEYIN